MCDIPVDRVAHTARCCWCDSPRPLIEPNRNLRLVRFEDITGGNKISYTYGGGKLTSIAAGN